MTTLENKEKKTKWKPSQSEQTYQNSQNIRNLEDKLVDATKQYKSSSNFTHRTKEN